MLQIFLTAGIFISLIVLAVLVVTREHEEEVKKEIKYENFECFCAGLHEYVTNITSMSYAANAFVSKKTAMDFEAERKDRAIAVRKCSNGAEGPRDRTKQIVRNYVSDYLGKNSRKAREKLAALVDFTNPSPHVMWETLLFMADREGNRGLSLVWNDLDIGDDTTVSEDALRQAYHKWVPAIITDDARREILVQLAYAKVYGLGVIDTIRYQKGIVEEIQIGLAGPAIASYSHKEQMQQTRDGEKRIRYSYESVHIMVRGDTYALPFLSFGSETEIKRVIKTLLKNTPAGELTEHDSKRITEGADGARYLCLRPNTTSSYAAFIRKFDAMNKTELKDMYKKVPNGFWSVRAIEVIVNTGLNLVITGQMATGKTTLVRAIISVMSELLSVRTVEVDSFELELKRYYPDRNVLPLRIDGERMNVKEIIGTVKKTTGHVAVIGEITTREMDLIYSEFTKFMQTVIATAHFVSTESMIADFTEALLNSGFTSERLAEKEVLSVLNFDIHIENRNRRRFVSYINEVEYCEEDLDLNMDEIAAMTEMERLCEEVRRLRVSRSRTGNYRIRTLLRWNYETMGYEFVDEMSEKAVNAFCLQTGIKRSEYPGFKNLVLDRDMAGGILVRSGKREDAVYGKEVKEYTRNTESVPETTEAPDLDFEIQNKSDMNLAALRKKGARG